MYIQSWGHPAFTYLWYFMEMTMSIRGKNCRFIEPSCNKVVTSDVDVLTSKVSVSWVHWRVRKSVCVRAHACVWMRMCEQLAIELRSKCLNLCNSFLHECYISIYCTFVPYSWLINEPTHMYTKHTHIARSPCMNGSSQWELLHLSFTLLESVVDWGKRRRKGTRRSVQRVVWCASYQTNTSSRDSWPKPHNSRGSSVRGIHVKA